MVHKKIIRKVLSTRKLLPSSIAWQHYLAGFLIILGICFRIFIKGGLIGAILILIGAVIYLWYIISVPANHKNWNNRGL